MFSPADHPVMACAGLFIPFFIILNLVFLIFWIFVKFKMAIVPVAFFILGWGSLTAYCPVNIFNSGNNGEQIKILTYNVMQMYQKNEDEDKTSLAYIKNSGADIVCLQEFPYRNDKILKSLKQVYPYIKSYNFNSVNAVACLSKYPVAFVKNIKIDSKYNGSAVFSVKYNDVDIPVIVNHLESNKLDAHDKEVYTDILKSPDENKVKNGGKHLFKKLADAMAIRGPQADVIAKYISENYSPYMLVCGDFNDTPVSYVHNRISDKLQDAFIEAGNGPGITYNRNFLYFRIDHIMAGDKYKIIECKVDDSIDVSDHYPLWCLMEIKK